MSKPNLYYCTDGQTVAGPLSPMEIELQIRSHKLPANVAVCEEGHQVWSEFYAWKKAKVSAMQFVTIEEMKTAAATGLRAGAWITLWIVLGTIAIVAVLTAFGIRPMWW